MPEKKKTDKVVDPTVEIMLPTEVIEEIGETAVESEVNIKDEIEQIVDEDHAEAKTAKAGKRSSKAIKEKEAEIAKEERKEAMADEANKPVHLQKPPRSKIERAGKKYQESAKLIEKDKEYSLKEALDLAIKSSPTKFDATVELHINLNVDPKHADQNIRDNLVLPSGTGRSIRVAVFADVDDEAKAKKAGADISSAEELMKDLEKGTVNFDVLIATPATMPKLGKFARTLGPKGLMPNPKSGTVTNDVAKAVTEAKAGKVEYRVDSTGIVHLGIGKISFGSAKLLPNAQAVFTSVKQAKPASVKGNYVKTIHMTTTMGPSILIATNEL